MRIFNDFLFKHEINQNRDNFVVKFEDWVLNPGPF